MVYTIGEMAKMLNIAPSALRFYYKKGLLLFLNAPQAVNDYFRKKIMNGFILFTA